MNTAELKELIETGKLDVRDRGVNDGKEWAFVNLEIESGTHDAQYVRENGIWVWENCSYGDLQTALGGEEAESEALRMLGLEDDHSVRA